MDLNSHSTNIRILLIDDDEGDFFIIKRLIAKMDGMASELEWVSTSDEAVTAVCEKRHDVYLVDYRLDAKSGLDVLREVEAHKRSEPFILMTGVGDRGIERESLQLAASDYIVKKNLSSDMLARTIYYALGRKEQEKRKLDELMELNKTKDEFISIASHQLRTPATTVKQYVAMTMEGIGGELTPSQQRLLQKAYDSNERQLAIINNLLKVAQIDAGRMNLARKTTNLTQMLDDAATDFRPSFEQIGQKLACDLQADISVDIDENALRMVIDNLLENAKKYSEFGGQTRLELSVDKDIVCIKCIDQGVGVSDPDRLFQKFSRIENRLSTEVGGTGLGLYWAQSIVRLHGGELSYEPNVPHGSKFIICIPRV